MKRRVYVMDCGDFVKIGVSGNVKRRSSEIPYKVKKIFSTDSMSSAFKVEHEMHMMFKDHIVPDAPGREYFDIPFDTAVYELKQKVKKVNPPKKAENNDFRYKAILKMLSLIEYLDDFDLGYMVGKAEIEKEHRGAKSNVFTDVITKICKLPKDKQDKIFWYVKGLVDGEEGDTNHEL